MVVTISVLIRSAAALTTAALLVLPTLPLLDWEANDLEVHVMPCYTCGCAAAVYDDDDDDGGDGAIECR